MNVTDANSLVYFSVIFSLCFSRVIGFMVVTPYFGDKYFPASAKVVLSMVISFLIAAKLVSSSELNINLDNMFAHIAINMFVGFIVGTILLMAITLVKLSAQIMAYAMQLGFAQMVDPNSGSSGSVIGNIMFVAFSLTFVSSGGLLVLIELLSYSFDVYGVDALSVDMNAAMDNVRGFSNVFMYSLAVAIPFTASALLVNVALAVVSKSAPSMNLFSIGFPLVIILGITALGILIPHVVAELNTFFIHLVKSNNIK